MPEHKIDLVGNYLPSISEVSYSNSNEVDPTSEQIHEQVPSEEAKNQEVRNSEEL